MKFPNFRLFHLFLLLSLVAALLWGTTQFGVEVAEVEILQYETVTHTGPILDGLEVQLPELVKVSFAYLNPESLRQYTVHAFLRPFPTSETFEPGDRIKFRYRAQPALWLKQSSPDQIALRKLAVNEEAIEEIIVEFMVAESPNR